jgi:uncharacterized protein involved in exopolysaccharide biosynthesis
VLRIALAAIGWPGSIASEARTPFAGVEFRRTYRKYGQSRISSVIPAPGQSVEEPAFAVRDILATLRAKWSWIALATGLVGGACTAYAFLATPIYRATAVLSPAAGEHGQGGLAGSLGQLGGLASLAGISVDAHDTATEEAFAILASREFLERFILDHELLPRLFPGRWDEVERKWKVAPERQPTLAKGAKYLQKNVVTASKDKKTGLVSVTVDWRDRIEAASWANEFVARVNAEMRARAMARATGYKEYLEKELESTQLVEARDAINRLIEAQIKERMIATVTLEYAFRTIGRALPPDADDRLSPKKLLIIIGGLLAGLFLGSGAALAMATPHRHADAAPELSPRI